MISSKEAVIQRYQPLRRLLSENEVDFFARGGGSAFSMRVKRFGLFLRYVKQLRRDVNRVQTALQSEMAAESNWEFDRLVNAWLTYQMCFFAMRSAAVLYVLHVPVAAGMAEESLASLQRTVALPLATTVPVR